MVVLFETTASYRDKESEAIAAAILKAVAFIFGLSVKEDWRRERV